MAGIAHNSMRLLPLLVCLVATLHSVKAAEHGRKFIKSLFILTSNKGKLFFSRSRERFIYNILC
jgi:hypothetical protein